MAPDESNPQETPVKRYSVPELAKLYNVSERSFRRYLQPIRQHIGKRVGHFYNTLQVKIIFQYLGAPFLALFAWFASMAEAFGRHTHYAEPADSYQDNSNIDHQVVHHPVDMSTAAANPYTTLLGVLMMVTGIKTLIEIAIDHPSQRQRYEGMNAHDATLWKTVRISAIVMQITVICISVVVAGYLVGKMIL